MYDTTTKQLLELQHRADNISRHQAEIYIMVMLCFNSIALAETMRLYDKLKSCRTPVDFLRFGGKHLADMLIASIRDNERQINKVSLGGNDKDRVYDLNARLCNVLDDTDEILSDTVNSVNDYFHRACNAKTLSTPKSPEVVEALVRCVFWLNLSHTLHKHIVNDVCEILKRCDSYNFLSLGNVFVRVVKIADHMVRYDNPKFNATSVIQSKQLHPHIDTILGTALSASFVDRIFVMRDGVDPHYRDNHKAIVTGVKPIQVEVPSI